MAKDEEHSSWPSKFEKDQLRGSLKLILLQLYEKLPKNPAFEANWKGEKAQYVGTSWVDRDLKKKKSHFEVLSSLILC